jgi:hypothetical protein
MTQLVRMTEKHINRDAELQLSIKLALLPFTLCIQSVIILDSFCEFLNERQSGKVMRPFVTICHSVRQTVSGQSHDHDFIFISNELG